MRYKSIIVWAHTNCTSLTVEENLSCKPDGRLNGVGVDKCHPQPCGLVYHTGTVLIK